jgi:hypothetical protein
MNEDFGVKFVSATKTIKRFVGVSSLWLGNIAARRYHVAGKYAAD